MVSFVSGPEFPGSGDCNRGAYGLVINDLPDAAAWMQPQCEGAPVFTMRVHHAPDPSPDDAPSTLNEDAADLQLIGGGRLRINSGTPVADYYLPNRPSDEDLLHPYLAPAAALFWQWSGREAIHAGAFEVGGGAVLVLGDKEGGKSTTLGWLASEGATTVLTDDLSVLEGAMVHAGPRSIDLRVNGSVPGVSAHLVRSGQRHRLRLPEAPATLPLAGVAVLEWGPSVALHPVPLSERIPLIARQRTFPTVAPSAVGLLELSSVPMIRASRPRDLAGLASFGRALLDYFS
jgi:hypothetical protein